eukprot:Seg1197.7 transcript_id=Seg1197.7/GoldUCD/mRNA.D3Y31 product="Copper transporter 5" protein_id=Seg1197.7/GoldUCD/D3Y31
MNYFHIGRNVTILFESWHAGSTKELAFYLILVFAFALLYECLRGFQKYFIFKLLIGCRRPVRSQREKDVILRKRLFKHIFTTLIYMLQLTCGYLLMLVVMTYNSLIFMAILLGIVLGFYLSDPLIVRGMESMYLAKIEKELTEEQSQIPGRRRRLLADETLDIEDYT